MFTKTGRALGFLKNSDIPQQLSQINITQTKHLILALCNNSPSPEQTLLPAVIAGAQCPRERQAGTQSAPTQASRPGGHQTLSILTAERGAPGCLLLHPAAERPAGLAPRSSARQPSGAQQSEQPLTDQRHRDSPARVGSGSPRLSQGTGAHSLSCPACEIGAVTPTVLPPPPAPPKSCVRCSGWLLRGSVLNEHRQTHSINPQVLGRQRRPATTLCTV